MSTPAPLPDKPCPGVYRHYKGSGYRVLGLARHSETLEPLVIYQALHDAGELWARPQPMFMANITHAGQEVPRFAYIGP